VAIAVVAIVLLVAGAFVAGNVIGDDSSEVSDLEEQVSDLEGNLSEAEDERDFTEEELEITSERKQNLANQLKAEQNLSGDVEELTESSGSAPEADYLAGVAGIVGQYTMKPLVEKGTTSGDETTWLATIEVKNNGSSPAEIFCGGSEATLIDTQGRSYEGEGVLSGSSANCGNAIGPGLTVDNYIIEFTLPTGAEAALIEIAGGEYGDGPFRSWAVGSE
jgi:hypothetical protein